MRSVEQEKNKLKITWIWLWYNDVTRILVIFGFPSIIAVAIGRLLSVDADHLQKIALAVYVFVFFWASVDNDYSNLRRIGLNEYRNKI